MASAESNGACGGRLGLDRDLGEVELGAAAHADRVVELDDLPAARALAADLVALEAVEDRREQPEERHDAGDQEPQDERRALDLGRRSRRRAPNKKADDQVRHQMWRSAQRTPITTADEQRRSRSAPDEPEDDAERELQRDDRDGDDDDPGEHPRPRRPARFIHAMRVPRAAAYRREERVGTRPGYGVGRRERAGVRGGAQRRGGLAACETQPGEAVAAHELVAAAAGVAARPGRGRVGGPGGGGGVAA